MYSKRVPQTQTPKVKLMRVNWDDPSESSVICSVHFPNDAYEGGLYSIFNIKRLRRLKPGVVRKVAEKRKKMKVNWHCSFCDANSCFILSLFTYRYTKGMQAKPGLIPAPHLIQRFWCC